MLVLEVGIEVGLKFVVSPKNRLSIKVNYYSDQASIEVDEVDGGKPGVGPAAN